MKRDFEFVCDIVSQFFGQDNLINRLNHIENGNVTGWEVWLQIEFSAFINNHDDVGWWAREYSYSIDRRSARHRRNILIDFVLRKKHSALSQYIALEIKQNQNFSTCIKGMMLDVRRIWLVRGSENDLRSMWCLGVHPSVCEEEVYACIDKYADYYSVKLLRSHIISRNINGTNFSYTLF